MVLFAVLPLLWSACSKNLLDDNGSERWRVSFGVVKGTQVDYDIKLDDGKLLEVESNVVPAYPVYNGQRVVANYTITENTEEGYKVRLNTLDSITTKRPIFKSAYTEEQLRADIGTDPVYLDGAWFSHDKFLTMNVDVKRADPEKIHLINLLVDDANSSESTVVAELRHNAYGDAPQEWATGTVAFNIRELVPAGKDEITVELKWTDYDGTSRSVTKLFKLSEKGGPSEPVLYRPAGTQPPLEVK